MDKRMIVDIDDLSDAVGALVRSEAEKSAVALERQIEDRLYKVVHQTIKEEYSLGSSTTEITGEVVKAVLDIFRSTAIVIRKE